MSVYTAMEETMQDLKLDDIPDLSQLPAEAEPWENGWYKGAIMGERSFTDKAGNLRQFQSSDTPSQNGLSRNIRLQVEITRQSDGRKMNQTLLVNYRPEDYSQQVVDRILENPNDQSLTRARLSLLRIRELAGIAGGRQLQRSSDGGFVISPLYGKEAYFAIGPQENQDGTPSPYKEIKGFKRTAGAKTKVL